MRHEAAAALIAKDAEIARLRGLLAEAVEAWEAFKVANVTTAHFDAVDRLDAALENRDG